MILDNQKRAVNLRIQKSIALLALIIAIGLLYFANVMPSGVWGLSRNQIALIFIVVFLLYYIFHYLRNHNYIYYSDSGNKIVLRYYSLRPLEDKKNSIEFNKNEFYKFEIKSSLSGLNEKIIIYRKTARGVAKYPGVSITALDKGTRDKMLASFQRLIVSNQAHL
jgi:hypothetical protein